MPRPDHAVAIQISDAHITPEDGAQGAIGGTMGMAEHTDSLATLGAVLDLLPSFRPRPRLLIFSGDVADSGHPQAYRRVRALVEPAARALGADVLWMPGNHDDIRAFRAHLVDQEPSEEPLDQVRWVGGVRVIGLDSSVLERPQGELRESQLRWLREQLQEPAPEGTLLVIHHPPLANPVQPFMAAIDLAQPERLAEAIRGRDVRLILTGHVHFTSLATLAGVPVWVAPSSAYQTDLAVPAGIMRATTGASFTRVDLLPDAWHATQITLPGDAAELYNWDLTDPEEAT